MKRFIIALVFIGIFTGLSPAYEYVGRSENEIDFFECKSNKEVAEFFNKNPDTFTLENNLSGMEKRTDSLEGENDYYIIGVLPSGSWVIIHRTRDYDYIFMPLEE